MSNQHIIISLSLLIAIALIISLVIWFIKKLNSIKDFNKYLSDLFPEINKANKSYEKLVNSNIYVNNYKLFTYKNKYRSLYENIDTSKLEKLAKKGNIKTATKQLFPQSPTQVKRCSSVVPLCSAKHTSKGSTSSYYVFILA